MLDNEASLPWMSSTAFESGTEARCCGDDAGEYYTTKNVGTARCCDSLSDCTINGACVSRTVNSGNYCCGTGSVDSDVPRELGGSLTCTTCNQGFQYDDGQDYCLNEVDCGGGGWNVYDEVRCRDPGYVSGSTCYYDNNGGGEANNCRSGGCVGISTTTLYPAGTRRAFNRDCLPSASTCTTTGKSETWVTCSISYVGDTCGSWTCFSDPDSSGQYLWGTPKANGALCNNNQGCASGTCASWRTSFMGTGNRVVQSNYRCASSTSYCVDSISPYYHMTGSVWSGNEMTCAFGWIYRCSSSTDQCNAYVTIADGVEYLPSRFMGGRKCYCSSSSSCTWSSSSISETTDARCGDGIDNDCDGDTDCADGGCSSTSACCRTRGETCGASPCCNTDLYCTSGRCCDDGTGGTVLEYWNTLPNPDRCQDTVNCGTPCTPWSTGCTYSVSSNIACCDITRPGGVYDEEMQPVTSYN